MYNKTDFKNLWCLTKRNSKIYFKDKSAFLPSLITPMILLVLFVTFLKKVYTNSLLMSIPESFNISTNLIDAFTGCWFMSSILGVSCVTIAFCANIIMASDKANKTIYDFHVTPTKRSVVSLSYLLSNLITTAIVSLSCMILCYGYLAIVGWAFPFGDIITIFLYVLINCIFGCVLAGVCEFFISSVGGISAIATMVSTLYGFISGAYMPLSQFSSGVRTLISFLPGTYMSAIIKKGCMSSIITEMSKTLPPEVMTNIKNSFDYNLYVDGSEVQLWQMFLIAGLTIALCLAAYLCFVFIKKGNKQKNKKQQEVKIS